MLFVTVRNHSAPILMLPPMSASLFPEHGLAYPVPGRLNIGSAVELQPKKKLTLKRPAGELC